MVNSFTRGPAFQLRTTSCSAVGGVVDTESATGPSVVWISFSYGFGPELAYYGPLFAEFQRRMPGTKVLVERDFPVERYPDLPLLPVFHFWRRYVKRVAGASAYEGELPMPKLSVPFAIARIPADVYVLIEFSAVAMVGLAVAKLKRKKTVLLVESHPKFRGSPPGRRAAEKIKGWLARRSDVVLAGNEAASEFASKTLAVKPNRLVVGPYLASQPSDGDEADRPLDNRVRFLFLNSVTSRKGIEPLVSAFGQLDDAARDRFVLDIVGRGDRMDEVKALISELGLNSNVEFHSWRPYTEVGSAYRSADIVICPTLADYRSLAGFEAVNCGKPVMVSRFDGAHDELVAATPSAISIDPLDTDRLAEQLRTLITDDDERARIINIARNQIPAKFGILAAGENVERAVAQALGQPRGSR